MKQYYHSALLEILVVTFFTPYLAIYAVCPAYNPVNPQQGENIWRLTSRIGTATDDLMYSTSLCCDCTCFITQADMPNFVISEPGVYCLAEDIVIDDAPALNLIDVQADNVVVDFRGYSITADIIMAVVNVNGHTNVAIKNGFITTTNGFWGISISNSSTIIIENCYVSNEAGQAILINSSSEVVCDSCIAHDCLGIGSGFAGFIFVNTANALLKDCQSVRTGLGFDMRETCSSIVFEGCSANENTSLGFQGDFSCNELLFYNCQAHNNSNIGFDIDALTARLLNCSAMYNASHGFRINLSGAASQHIELIGSTAIGNTGFGIFNNLPAASYVFNNISSGNGSGNYTGVTAATLIAPGAVTTATGYWSNING